MKKIIKTGILVLFLSSFQCENDSNNLNVVTTAMLQEKKMEILNYIASFSCSNNVGCSYIAFGSKPCGGPWEYLVYPNSVNQNVLENLVNNYNELEKKYNIQTQAVSDCAAVLPPQNIGCLNGTCSVLD